jgi:molybdate transport system ATP-binding protein
MDEPLSSLDESRKEDVLPFIAKLPRAFSIPILYVTHSVDEIERLADYLVLMADGKSIATGHAAEMVKRIQSGTGFRTQAGLTSITC